MPVEKNYIHKQAINALNGTIGFNPFERIFRSKARDKQRAAQAEQDRLALQDKLLSESHPGWKTSPTVTSANYSAVVSPVYSPVTRQVVTGYTRDKFGQKIPVYTEKVSQEKTGETVMSYYQTFGEAEQNLHNQQVKFLATLKTRLAAGTITQKYYDDSEWLAYQNLGSPDAGYWAEFQSAVTDAAKNLPTQIKDGTSAAGSWLGETIGGAYGSTIAGATSGFFSKGGVSAVIAVIVAIVFFWKVGPKLLKYL